VTPANSGMQGGTVLGQRFSSQPLSDGQKFMRQTHLHVANLAPSRGPRPQGNKKRCVSWFNGVSNLEQRGVIAGFGRWTGTRTAGANFGEKGPRLVDPGPDTVNPTNRGKTGQTALIGPGKNQAIQQAITVGLILPHQAPTDLCGGPFPFRPEEGPKAKHRAYRLQRRDGY